MRNVLIRRWGLPEQICFSVLAAHHQTSAEQEEGFAYFGLRSGKAAKTAVHLFLTVRKQKQNDVENVKI
jgi:HD-like signal output (HDOD) protein